METYQDKLEAFKAMIPPDLLVMLREKYISILQGKMADSFNARVKLQGVQMIREYREDMGKLDAQVIPTYFDNPNYFGAELAARDPRLIGQQEFLATRPEPTVPQPVPTAPRPEPATAPPLTDISHPPQPLLPDERTYPTAPLDHPWRDTGVKPADTMSPYEARLFWREQRSLADADFFSDLFLGNIRGRKVS